MLRDSMASSSTALTSATVPTVHATDIPKWPLASALSDDARQEILSGAIHKLKLEIDASPATESDKRSKLECLDTLKQRAVSHLKNLSVNLETLYKSPDIPKILAKLLELSMTQGLQRPEELKKLDIARESDPLWFYSNKSIGGNMYVDRHCETVTNLMKEIDYLKSMNINMLHLLPTIYLKPDKDNDGGYAISSLRALSPDIGTMDELRTAFNMMRKEGISPIMDVTINHVADEHAWAQAAKAGDAEKLAYFFTMDEAEKNEYDKHLTSIFPDIRIGNFTKNNEIGKFLWTTFMSTQWDLNYSNPNTLAAMAGELLFLQNQGAEVLRLDAVPFLWKEKGTDCQNHPNVQAILGVFNTLSKIAAPGTVLLAEALCEPEKIKRNMGADKCQLAYSTMTHGHLWDALAHEDASLMAETLKRNSSTPEGSTLLNMIRSHDDMSFLFDPNSMKAVEVDRQQRNTHLHNFYLGGQSYSKAMAFSENNKSGEVFVAGTTGSLAGVEDALETRDPQKAEAAVKRIKLLNSVLASMPGVPMINLVGGDDRGQTNDYSFMKDEIQRKDPRWLHRVKRDMDFKTKSPLEMQVMDQIFSDTAELNRVRAKDMPAFGPGSMQVMNCGKKAVLAFARANEQQEVTVLANFSQVPQKIDPEHLRAQGLTGTVIDKIGPQKDQVMQTIDTGIELAPYQCMWLVPTHHDLPQPHTAEASAP